MGQLTDKQQRFCQEYLIDLNAKEAAVREKKSGLDQEDKARTINVDQPISQEERRQQLVEELRLLQEADAAGTALVTE